MTASDSAGNSRRSWSYSWAAHQERNAYVELEGKALSLYQSELAQVITVIARVNYVRVLQLPQILQLLVDPFHGHVDALESLQPLRHEEIRKSTMDGLHFRGNPENPLLVRVRGIIVGGRAEIIKRGIPMSDHASHPEVDTEATFSSSS